MKTKVLPAVAAVLTLCFAYFFVLWFVDRYEVSNGQSLLLRYKGPLIFGGADRADAGHWAAEGQVGVLQQLRGPGRHFYSPIWWERQLVDDYLIEPGKIGVVTCKLGDPLPPGEFLVDGEIGETKHKGVLRKCLGPGRYRINPYGYEVKIFATEVNQSGKTNKHSGWVEVPTGSVGVVTNLAANPLTGQSAGIQDKVLPPGLYPINPREQQIDILGVGYRETSVHMEAGRPFAELVKADADGNVVDADIRGGINFPSSDGFDIVMDFTAIWGVMPDQAANAIRMFGNVDLVESKVVLPQIESICRNNGSEYSAVELLVGEERERFQNNTLEEFSEVLTEKQISLQYGAIRHIYIPHEVRLPIQMSFISDELKLTREQEQLTTKEEGNLREAERLVDLEAVKVDAETKRLVAERIAEGQKTVGLTQAETRRLIAAVERETADLKAQATLLLGEAENQGKQLIEEANAGRFALAVDAFGSPEAYNNWTFANSLPEDIDLQLIYAGPGTMWTDLKEAVRITKEADQP